MFHSVAKQALDEIKPKIGSVLLLSSRAYAIPISNRLAEFEAEKVVLERKLSRLKTAPAYDFTRILRRFTTARSQYWLNRSTS